MVPLEGLSGFIAILDVELGASLGYIDEDDPRSGGIGELVDVADLPPACGRHVDFCLVAAYLNEARAPYRLSVVPTKERLGDDKVSPRLMLLLVCRCHSRPPRFDQPT